MRQKVEEWSQSMDHSLVYAAVELKKGFSEQISVISKFFMSEYHDRAMVLGFVLFLRA